MGGKSSKDKARKREIDEGLFGEGEELPEAVQERRKTQYKMENNGIERVNKVKATNDLTGSMKSLKSNASVSDASWYTDNSSVRFTEYENYDYPFENVVFEGGGNKGLAYCGAVRVSR